MPATNTAALAEVTLVCTLALTASHFTVAGRKYEITTPCRTTEGRHSSQKTEVYREYSDEPGLMQFIGYLCEIATGHAANEMVCAKEQRAIHAVIHPYVADHFEAHGNMFHTAV